LSENVHIGGKFFGITISKGGVEAVYAIIVTIIAVAVVVFLNRLGKRMANKSAFDKN